MEAWKTIETRTIWANWNLLDRLQEHWPEALRLNEKFDSPLYNAYPLYLLPAFPGLAEEALHPFTLAGSVFSQSLFQLDRLIDEDAVDRPAVLVSRILAWQFEAYRQLHHLFPADSAFWDRFRGYLSEYAAANMRERAVARGEEPWSGYSEEEAVTVAVRKAGVARTVVAGLAELSSDDAPLAPLNDSIGHYNAALQYRDDLEDWKKDLAAGAPSLLMVRLFDSPPQAPADPAALERLAREVYYGGHAVHMLQSVVAHVDRAAALADGLPVVTWREHLELLRERAESTLADVEEVISRNVERVRGAAPFRLELPDPHGPWQEAAWDALRYLADQSRKGWGEARHLMSFPRAHGWRGARDYQAGDVFQRAVVADALCDADPLVDGRLGPLLVAEAEYLVQARLPHGVGGWSYFPGLPELAPDADDLAQVIQVLVRTDRAGLADLHAAEPLRVLFDDCAHPDGSFETWIIPAYGRTSAQEVHRSAADGCWGTGPDVEVVANVAYALSLYAPERYAREVRRAAEFVEREQGPDGSWTGTWYFGPHYGTYACMRTLAAVRPGSRARSGGAAFVRGSQRADGGWAAAPDQTRSDALSTALALLSLATAARDGAGGPGDVARARRGLAFLRAARDGRPGWPKHDYIRMDQHRAQGGEPLILTYGSRTVTTAYVLKAAVAWDALDPEPRERAGAGLELAVAGTAA